MASTLGGLIITLGLDAAEFFTGLNKSEQQARKFAKKLERELKEGAKGVAVGFGVMTAAATAAIYAFDRMVNQAAKFKDLEERTGAAAETLASYAVAAKVTEVSVDDVANAMNRLAKNLTGVDDESKAAGAALAALGIPIEQFKKLDPGQQMMALARAFSQFEDGGEKAAAAMALMGKAGATMLPFLKELASKGPTKILSQEEIDRADEFADAHKRIQAQLELYAQVASIQVIPVLDAMREAAAEYLKELIGVNETMGTFARDAKIREFAEDAARALAVLANAVDIVARGFQIAGKAIGAFLAAKDAINNFEIGRAREIIRELHEDVKNIYNRDLPSTLLDQALERSAAAQRLREGGPDFVGPARPPGFKEPKQKLPYSGTLKKDTEKNKANQEAKRLLDAQLKQQEVAIRAEENLLKDREFYLKARYDDSLISAQEFYSARQQLQDEANQKIFAAQKEMENAARRYAARPGLDADEKLAAEAKVAELVEKRTEAEREAARAAHENGRAQVKAMQDYEDAVSEVNAQLLELQGNTEAAAVARFRLQQRDFAKRATAQGDTATLDALRVLENQVAARERLNSVTQKYGNIMQEVGLAQARVNLEQQSGAITSLDAINKRADIARQYVGALTEQAAAAERAARAMAPGPEQEAALLYVQRLQLEIEQLKATAEELENTFRDIFVDSFAGALESAVMGTKSLSDAFKDMEKQIVASITRIAAQNIAEAMFGKSGVGSAVPGFFASLFGGSASGALANSAGWLAGAGAFASGGSPPVGQASLVGERGPELFVPRAAGTIVPNSELMARRAQRTNNVSINISVPGSTSRASADQIAAATGVAVQRALARTT